MYLFDYNLHGWLEPKHCKKLTDDEIKHICIIYLIVVFAFFGIIAIVCALIHFLN